MDIQPRRLKYSVFTGHAQISRLFGIIMAMIILWMATTTELNAQQPVTSPTQSMEQTAGVLDRFSRRCERRTQKAEKRLARYEKKMKATDSDSAKSVHSGQGQGKEPSGGQVDGVTGGQVDGWTSGQSNRLFLFLRRYFFTFATLKIIEWDEKD